MTTEQLELEINHILDSGANSIRLATLCKRYANQQTEELQAQILHWRNKYISDRLLRGEYDELFGITTDRQGDTDKKQPPQSEKYSWWH